MKVLGALLVPGALVGKHCVKGMEKRTLGGPGNVRGWKNGPEEDLEVLEDKRMALSGGLVCN